MTPEEIAAVYHSRNGTSAVALGDMMLACRREHGLSQQELARRMVITPGVVHHHESVAGLPRSMREDVEASRLTFKEARSLADLGWGRGHSYHADPRLPEIAALFTSGRLSSMYVEPVVAAAKANPKANVDELVALAFKRAKQQPRNWNSPPVAIRRAHVETKALQAHMLALAGEVDAWGMTERCEIERMPVLNAARLLTDRLARVVFKTDGVLAPVGVEGLPTLAEATVAHAGASNGVGNRRLALLLEEPRKPLSGQKGLL